MFYKLNCKHEQCDTKTSQLELIKKSTMMLLLLLTTPLIINKRNNFTLRN